MVGDIVENDLQAAPMRLGDEPVERLQIPKQRLDVDIVADVITKIGHWRGEDR
jgi:hypothetical protein